MNPHRLILMCGLPGSGKSTTVEHMLASIPGLQCVCADDIRRSMGTRFARELEPHVHAICKTMVRAHMYRGLPVVLDECNTVASLLKPYLMMGQDHGYEVAIVHIDTPQEICVERRLVKEPHYPWADIINAKARQLAESLPAIKGLIPEGRFITLHGTADGQDIPSTLVA